MNSKTKKLSVGLLVLTTLAAILWCRMSDNDIPRHAWFYDANTDTLFAGDVTALPPIEAPSGGLKTSSSGEPAGVLARVLRRRGQHENVIVLLTKYTPEAKKLIEVVRSNPSEALAHQGAIAEGTFVALPPSAKGGKIEWAAVKSTEGQAIIASMQATIGEGPYDIILP